MRQLITPVVIAAIACIGCRPTDPEPPGLDEQVPIVVGSGGPSATSSATGGGNTPMGGEAALRLGTWNLHNFSKWGTTEYRIGDIATEIERLDADILGLQELKVAENTQGEAPQAWDVLLEELEDYEGVHNPWNTFDTTVGLVYKRSTTTLVESQALFTDDSFAFPRAPLEATFEIDKGQETAEVTVIVLHLKAFGDSVDRRRAACDKLDTYLQQTPDAQVVLLGDLNDDPYDPPAENSFVGTFLDAEPTYHFVTSELAPESVTSLGYYHFVDGTRIEGEFLDHFILTGPAMNAFTTVEVTIESVPEAERDDFEQTHSDHFPVMLDLE